MHTWVPRPRNLETEIYELRELVCQYVAVNAGVMSGHTVCVVLIEEGGAFVRDL